MRNTTPYLKILPLLLLPLGAFGGDQPELASLEAEPEQAKIEQLVASFTSRAHYANRELSDELSAQVFDRYLETLDPSKIYFTQSDINGFAKYRHEIDDALKSGQVDIAFDMYRELRARVLARINKIEKLLESKPDFSIDESFEFDRENAQWAKSFAELDDYWRKRVKNEAIGLLLAGKKWEEAQETLHKRYENFRRRVLQVNSMDAFELFINSYAQTLDPHTVYFSPHDSEEFEIRMSLSYEGIGASLQAEDEYVKVVRILPGGSADKSGLLEPNDRITGVSQGKDGEFVDVIGWRLDDVVDLIRGPKDSLVRLQILPAGRAPGSEEKVIELVRSEIQLEEQAAQAEVIEIPRGGEKVKIGVIEVPAFYLDYKEKMLGKEDYRSTTRDVRRLIGELKSQGVQGLVIDLRDNGGGSLPEATEMTGLFIDQGPVVQIRSSGGQLDVAEDLDPGVAYDGPLVVLVNRFSASASEIFAGAIQDYRRGLVVGSTTFGKGTVQNLIDLNRYMNTDAELGQLKMTIGKFYRVTGSSTQHRGVEPDIVLPSEVDPGEAGESAQPTALPWDEIQAAGELKEVRMSALDMLPELRDQIAAHQAKDELFQLYVEDVNSLARQRAQISVSLNLEDRRAERKALEAEALARINERRQALGMKPVENLEAANDDPDDYDVQLQEAARIVANYLAELTPKDLSTRLAASQK